MSTHLSKTPYGAPSVSGARQGDHTDCDDYDAEDFGSGELLFEEEGSEERCEQNAGLAHG